MDTQNESVEFRMISSSAAWDREPVVKSMLADANDIESTYLQAGTALGEALSYAAYMKIVSLDRMLGRLVKQEKQYADLGYQPVSIDAFVQLGGWGTDISDQFKQQRAEGIPPIYHALQYQQEYNLEPKENKKQGFLDYIKSLLHLS